MSAVTKANHRVQEIAVDVTLAALGYVSVRIGPVGPSQGCGKRHTLSGRLHCSGLPPCSATQIWGAGGASGPVRSPRRDGRGRNRGGACPKRAGPVPAGLLSESECALCTGESRRRARGKLEKIMWMEHKHRLAGQPHTLRCQPALIEAGGGISTKRCVGLLFSDKVPQAFRGVCRL
jgi:hypothetical protein